MSSTVGLKGLVAEGFVTGHPRLLQTFVAKWPPKPFTRPMFLMRTWQTRHDAAKDSLAAAFVTHVTKMAPFTCSCLGGL